jgi:hypothetical protein
MTIYKVTVAQTTTEFASLEAAETFAASNGVDLNSIISEERTSPAEPIKDVTPRQIRQALILSGISAQQIEDALATLPEPTQSLARAEWEYSIAFQRERPLVGQVGQMLGWTSEQLDDLWHLAASL